MADPFGWLRMGGTAQVTGLKARPELNGQAVTIKAKDSTTGRWRCEVISSGESIKVKADNLQAPKMEADGDDSKADTEGAWLQRGAHAAVHGEHELAGQVVRILAQEQGGQFRCVVRATNATVSIDATNLRPLAGAAAPKPKEEAPAAAPAPAAAKTGGSDWAAVELERRRLAEGFRSGFEPGATVVLEGLRSMQDLNGKQGQLVAFNSQSLRWEVDIDGVGKKSLNPSNLVPVPATKRKRAPEDGKDADPSAEAESAIDQQEEAKRPRHSDQAEAADAA
mmetsp:Transcript_31246/g.72872  ORF Transcript_31246/g.72872 Transcript_31246/m.72872 type:complete len:280 (+) Transcript_31246:68-907(+)